MNRFRSLLFLLTVMSLAGGCSHMPSWLGGPPKAVEKLPGKRITALPVSTELKPEEALKSVPITLPPVNANSQWEQHTGIFTAAQSNLAGGSFDREESANIGDGVSYEHTLVARPVVGAGMVFAMDASGRISAHDAAHIDTIKWSSMGVAEEGDNNNIGGGLAFDQGKLFATSGRGLVAAIDAATGKELWYMSVHIPFRSAPKVGDGKLFVITIDNQLFALAIADGKVLWTQQGINESAGLMNSISPAFADGAVIVPYSSGEIYALAASDGKPLWSESLSLNKHTEASDIFSGIGGDPVVDGQTVYTVSNGGLFAAFGLDRGQHLWERPVASVNTPWVTGDYLFLLSSDNTVVCFMKYDGRVRWATKLESFEDPDRKLHPITWRGPVLVNGKLAVVSSVGKLVLISAADGKIADTKSIPDGIFTAPVVAGGRMYLVGKNATLYSLQ